MGLLAGLPGADLLVDAGALWILLGQVPRHKHHVHRAPMYLLLGQCRAIYTMYYLLLGQVPRPPHCFDSA